MAKLYSKHKSKDIIVCDPNQCGWSMSDHTITYYVKKSKIGAPVVPLKIPESISYTSCVWYCHDAEETIDCHMVVGDAADKDTKLSELMGMVHTKTCCNCNNMVNDNSAEITD